MDDAVLGLVWVLVLCLVLHVASGWWLRWLLLQESDKINTQINGIDNGLGFLAQKLMDPETWTEIIQQSQPEFNPLQLILEYFQSQNSPQIDYNRDEAGLFNGTTQDTETVPTEAK